MRYLAPLGRLLFTLIFLFAPMSHFTARGIEYAAKQGVPWAGVLVPLSGVIALLGGLSILFGYKARLGAWLLVIFLVPVTLTMHAFWNVADPMMRGMQMANFMKNVALCGGALLIAVVGAGPVSFDERTPTGAPERGVGLPHGGREELPA